MYSIYIRRHCHVGSRSKLPRQPLNISISPVGRPVGPGEKGEQERTPSPSSGFLLVSGSPYGFGESSCTNSSSEFDGTSGLNVSLGTLTHCTVRTRPVCREGR